jgi:hypothetical protein
MSQLPENLSVVERFAFLEKLGNPNTKQALGYFAALEPWSAFH